MSNSSSQNWGRYVAIGVLTLGALLGIRAWFHFDSQQEQGKIRENLESRLRASEEEYRKLAKDYLDKPSDCEQALRPWQQKVFDAEQKLALAEGNLALAEGKLKAVLIPANERCPVCNGKGRALRSTQMFHSTPSVGSMASLMGAENAMKLLERTGDAEIDCRECNGTGLKPPDPPNIFQPLLDNPLRKRSP